MRRDCDGHLLTSRWRLTVGKAEGPGACPREPAALGAEEGPRERETGAEGHSLSPGHLGPQMSEVGGGGKDPPLEPTEGALCSESSDAGPRP